MSVYKMIPESKTVYDIGTDHAYLPIFLSKKNICEKIVGCDIKKGPLLTAKKNLCEERLLNEIELRQGNGFEPIEPCSEDTVIITGMGGKTITDILENGKEKAGKCKCIIIQANYTVELVRDWLDKNEFSIIDEALCKESGRIYVIIKAASNTEKANHRKLEAGNAFEVEKNVAVYKYIGKKLIEKKDPLLFEYVERNIRIIKNIICGIKKSEKNIELLKNFCEIKDDMENLLCRSNAKK